MIKIPLPVVTLDEDEYVNAYTIAGQRAAMNYLARVCERYDAPPEHALLHSPWDLP